MFFDRLVASVIVEEVEKDRNSKLERPPSYGNTAYVYVSSDENKLRLVFSRLCIASVVNLFLIDEAA